MGAYIQVILFFGTVVSKILARMRKTESQILFISAPRRGIHTHVREVHLSMMPFAYACI